jgi:hypothetical protein
MIDIPNSVEKIRNVLFLFLSSFFGVWLCQRFPVALLLPQHLSHQF